MFLSAFTDSDVRHVAKANKQIMRSFTSSAVRGSFTKRRPLEDGLALMDEHYQRFEEKLAADPDSYGLGMTLRYTLLTKT